MRNKYTKEFENFVRENVSKYTKKEFVLLLQDKFNLEISTDILRRYLNKHHIKERYLDYKEHNKRNVLQYPIGTEKMTSEGVFVKVAQPDIWKRKARIMYEKYHNCKLKDDEYIVFLNQDKSDFSKDNLKKISRKETAYLSNRKMFSKEPKLTELGILTARLMIKTKELKEVN